MRRMIVLVAMTLVGTGCTDAGGPPSWLSMAPPTTTTTTSTTTTTTTTTSTTTTTIPTAYLNVRVVDTEGSPVPGAGVTVGGESARSDADGLVVLGPVPVADLVVSRPGWLHTEAGWDGGAETVEVVIEPRLVRALRVSATVAADPDAFAALLDLADETIVNAFVFDTKQEGGTVLYDTEVGMAHDVGAVKPMYDPAELLSLAKARGLYTITRVVTFEDAIRAEAVPSEKLAGPWLDPRNRAAWEYPLALAEEACRLGFDEVQFDYIRWPTGRAAEQSGQRALSQAERIEPIEGFLAEARTRLHDLGCATSADIFGIVVSTADDQGIGQRPEETSRHVDAVSPMVYPSHYSNGWLGFPDPNDFPYEVTADAIDSALPRISPGSVLRPWLQSFWWTPAQVKASIRAAEDRDVGWILWNAVGNFSREAIPTVDDVEEWRQARPQPDPDPSPAPQPDPDEGGEA